MSQAVTSHAKAFSPCMQRCQRKPIASHLNSTLQCDHKGLAPPSSGTTHIQSESKLGTLLSREYSKVPSLNLTGPVPVCLNLDADVLLLLIVIYSGRITPCYSDPLRPLYR